MGLKKQNRPVSQAAKHALTGRTASGRSVCAPGAMPFHCIADRFLKETQSMLFLTFLHRRQRQVRRAPRRRSRTRLLLEWLEPRNLLSVMNVNTDSDLS